MKEWERENKTRQRQKESRWRGGCGDVNKGEFDKSKMVKRKRLITLINSLAISSDWCKGMESEKGAWYTLKHTKETCGDN